MKKLKLSIEQLEQVEVLTRSQLKNVLGGVTASESCSGWICTFNLPPDPPQPCTEHLGGCSCFVSGWGWQSCIHH